MKTRKQKEKILEDLKAKTAQGKAIILCDFTSVKSKDLFDLRDQLKEKGVKLQVVKNSLLKIAFKDQKIEIPQELLDLPLVVAFADDEITPSKIIWQFSKENENLKILGAVLDKHFETKEKIFALALLPSQEELYTRLLWVLLAPKYKMVFTLKYNQMKLVNILRQIQN